MVTELDTLLQDIIRVQDSINKLQKYKSNHHYKKKYEIDFCNLNRQYTFFKEKTKGIKKTSLTEKMNKLDSFMRIILSDNHYDMKLDAIKKLKLFWPKLEVEFSRLTLSSGFEIPSVIPKNEQYADLLEAIKSYDNECYLSSLVLCRRSYEGTLVAAYKSIVKKEPVEDVHCALCKKKIRSNSYMGIVKLHKWAIDNNLITEKLKQVGFLLSDLGAGGAHPPLKEFPRDPEISEIGLTITIALLKQIYSKI